MSLDLSRLEKVVELAHGVKRARCPACAEAGQDRKGEHLRLYPDGRFGCCVHPRDREHRKRIFALAGQRAARAIQVRVTAVENGAAIQSGVLGRLGRVFESPTRVKGEEECWDGWDGGKEVESSNLGVRTLGTDKTAWAENVGPIIGTLGTPFLNPRVYVEKCPEPEEKNLNTHKGYATGVPSVPSGEERKGAAPLAESRVRQPHLTPGGTLVIPFESDGRFHWWNGGQALQKTIEAVKHHFRDAEGKEHNGIGV